MKYLFRLILTLGIFSLMAGCSSSDDGPAKPAATTYTGKTTAAVITSTNAQPLSISSTEATKEGTDSDADDFSLFKTGTSTDSANAIVSKIVTPVLSNTTSVNDLCSGGSISVNGIDETTDLNSNLDFTIDYNNCTITGSNPTVRVDGLVRFQGNLVTDTFTVTLTNFTIWEGNDEGETLNVSVSCLVNMSLNEECTINADFKGNDNRVYRLQDFKVTDLGFGSYTIEGRIYDPDHGYIEVATTADIIFSSCADGNPSSGTIQFTSGSNTVVVNYVDCTTYNVTFNSDPTVPYSW